MNIILKINEKKFQLKQLIIFHEKRKNDGIVRST